MKSYKGRSVSLGSVVDVYRNLNQGGGYSIRDSKSGLVLAHCESVCLREAVFKVSQAGRNKTLEIRRKRVHAYIRGVLHDVDNEVPNGMEVIYYNPYETIRFFHQKSGTYVDYAEEVHCRGKFAYAKTIL
ncbi:hypothetical protein IQ283_08215 (plasmid) [Alkalihalobacillus hwajinpoensis]|uniref:hypothetical protein n=1 Tax=Guptibacillus hwajinpoensis TaxID=208199 RepID=UPI00188444D7|nr:hypothetical protein [Pseudalkalibacillus hwajinpoensis]MBF0706593.1 hypothetical protein [Pseudalkalibacillus hwajinpoensis]